MYIMMAGGRGPTLQKVWYIKRYIPWLHVVYPSPRYVPEFSYLKGDTRTSLPPPSQQPLPVISVNLHFESVVLEVWVHNIFPRDFLHHP